VSQLSHPLGDPQLGTFDDAYRAVGELIEYGKALLRERLERPPDDLGAVLAAAGIDEDDGGTFFELLITAGIDTTGAAIAHGLLALSARLGVTHEFGEVERRHGVISAASASAASATPPKMRL